MLGQSASCLHQVGSYLSITTQVELLVSLGSLPDFRMRVHDVHGLVVLSITRSSITVLL